MGQILLDSGKYDEAERHLKKWVNRFGAKGNLLLAGQGALELADLFFKIEKYGDARKYYEKASDFLPQFELIPNPHRGSTFTRNLKQRIYNSNVSDCTTGADKNVPIHISTFGNLKIQAGSQIIVDNGRNNLAFSMLKAIIACGGSHVSINWLMDELWPDLEGDRAYSTFKVTLFRLRRIVSVPKQKPPPWIALRDKKLSISESLCAVDSIVFQDKIKTRETEISDIHEQAAALELYRADFLKQDDGYPWIVHYRNKLRQMYMDGVMALAAHCLNSNNLDLILLHLRKALEFDNLNEDVYALLMKTYLRMGLPSQAIETYNIAETTLFQDLNIQPGSLLSDLKKEALRS
jgi:two-component SAPR family response regulator